MSLPVDFYPLKSWSDRLRLKVRWRNLDLTPSPEAQPHSRIVEMSHLSLGPALKMVYPNLEFSEFLRLVGKLIELQVPQNDIVSVADEFSYSLSDGTLSLVPIFRELPQNFQFWCDLKKMKFNDLRPLLRIHLLTAQAYLEALPKTLASKSQGAEIIELLADLMDMLEPEKFINEKDPHIWLNEMRKLSYPSAFLKDQTRAQKVQKFSWPLQTRGSWMRWGDQAGLSIQIQSSSPKDLEKKLEELKRICDEWENI